jgi:glycosyltransferase involved in cell wall biosynthesis
VTSLVSVVVPTYRRNARLRSAIASVQELPYDNLEIVVVDDSGERYAASDVEKARSGGTRLQYVDNSRNEGVVLARKVGIEHADGEYVHLLDDDDRLLPGAITKKVDILDESGVGVAYSGFVLGDQNRRVLPVDRVRGDVLDYALMFDLAPCIPSTMLVDRDSLMSVDFEYIATNGLHNEHAMQVQLAQRTQYEFVNEALVHRGMPVESRGGSPRAVEEYKRTYEAYSDLYEEFPPAVRRRAVGYLHFLQGQLQIDAHLWSPRAIVEFLLASIYRPGVDPVYVGCLVSSLFGRPGYRIGEAAHGFLVSEQQNGRSV